MPLAVLVPFSIAPFRSASDLPCEAAALNAGTLPLPAPFSPWHIAHFVLNVSAAVSAAKVIAGTARPKASTPAVKVLTSFVISPSPKASLLLRSQNDTRPDQPSVTDDQRNRRRG